MDSQVAPPHFFSGKALNAALVAALLREGDEKVRYIGTVNNYEQKELADWLENRGVTLIPVAMENQLRIATTIISKEAAPNGVTPTHISPKAPRITDKERGDFVTRFGNFVSDARIAIIGGSLPDRCSVSLYADMIELAVRNKSGGNLMIIVDSKGAPLIAAARAGGDTVLKLNKQELGETLRLDEGAIKALTTDGVARLATNLIKMGAKNVVVTDGANPVVWVNGSERSEVFQVPKVNAINSIGPGDAFAAGLAIAALNGSSFSDCVKYAIACGSAATLELLPGKVDKDQVSRLQAL